MDFTATPSTGSGGATTFLKIEDGQSVTGIFQGQPYTFWNKWIGSRSEVCSETDPDKKFRFKINFVQKVNGTLTPLIWEGGGRLYDDLKKLNAEYTLEETIVKITRSGTGMETRYSIMPIKENQVDAGLKTLLSALTLHELDPDVKELPF